MPTDLTPEEARRLRHCAERLARQWRREAVRDFPDAEVRWLAAALLSAARGALHRLCTGAIHSSPRS